MSPPDRTRAMLERSRCRALVVDRESEKQLGAILEGLAGGLLILLPDHREVAEWTARWPQHRFLGAGDLVAPGAWHPKEVSPDAIAYLLFTSGSTGVPKGVMVAYRKVRAYVDFMADRFSIRPEDRFSQTFDMTFDLSVADLFVAWDRGACVCCPSEKTLSNPGRFINEARLTVWFSVPSMAVFMKRLGTLKPGTYPHLRVSLFCGEAWPVEVARAWVEAAPESIVENVYGPTELTIACTYYRWDPVRSPGESLQGLVPIGEPFPGMRVMVADESLEEVPPGADGELLMTGPQLTLGYWQDPDRTAAAFVRPPGCPEVYYLTGDLVRRPAGQGPLLYLGRTDRQIKILGHRVELGEVEAVVREESGVNSVMALGWPINPGGAGGVEIFLQTGQPVPPDLKERVARRLPVYMAPRRIRPQKELPLNVNGKYDRKALLSILENKNDLIHQHRHPAVSAPPFQNQNCRLRAGTGHSSIRF